jgi:hypothetical protein
VVHTVRTVPNYLLYIRVVCDLDTSWCSKLDSIEAFLWILTVNQPTVPYHSGKLEVGWPMEGQDEVQ